jgi:hypothetical protein
LNWLQIGGGWTGFAGAILRIYLQEHVSDRFLIQFSPTGWNGRPRYRDHEGQRPYFETISRLKRLLLVKSPAVDKGAVACLTIGNEQPTGASRQ